MESFLFQVDEEECIEKFLNSTIQGKKHAVILKQKLWGRLIINESTTVASINSPASVGLMTALFNTLSLKLSHDVAESSWGCGIVSDFQVLHNFGNQKNRTAFIEEHSEFKSVTISKINELAKQSTKCRRWLLGQRTNLISHWELPDGDIPEKKTKKRESKTPESVKKETEEQLEATSHDNSVSEYNNLVCEVNEEEGTTYKVITRSQGLPQQPAAGAAHVEKKSKKGDHSGAPPKMETAENALNEAAANLPDLLPTLTMAEIIDSFPRFAEDGMFLRIDPAAKILYVQNVEGESQSFDFSSHYVL
jgi:hypothetical protein